MNSKDSNQSIHSQSNVINSDGERYILVPISPDRITLDCKIVAQVRKANSKNSKQANIPNFLLDGKDSLYYSSAEFYNDLQSVSPNEKLALTKFLNLSDKATIDEIAKVKWEQFESFDKSEKIWESVTSVEEYINCMSKFLSGTLMRSPSHGGPPDPESYLIISELIYLTKLGCPTINSQPWTIRSHAGNTYQQLPYIIFFCPKRIVTTLQGKLAKDYTVVSKCFNQEAILNSHPRNQEKEYSALLSTKNPEGKWVPDESPVSGFVNNLIENYGDWAFKNETQLCQESCQKEFQENYAWMAVVGTDYSNLMFTKIISSVGHCLN